LDIARPAYIVRDCKFFYDVAKMFVDQYHHRQLMIFLLSIIGPAAVMVRSIADAGELFENFFLLTFSFTIGAPIFSIATSLGSTIIAALVVFVSVIERAAALVERRGVWKVLNFKKKPMQSSAIIVIVLFTAIYWPLMLLWRA
jgi:hypothetical protein